MKNLLLLAASVLLSFIAFAQCGSNSYTEPQFTIEVQNPACPLVGEIRVTSASGGVGPYTYTLMPNNISNSTGLFSNLDAGTYTVQMRDACGTIRSRQATITPYIITASSTIVAKPCGNFDITISASVSGPKLEYGYSLHGGPITWSTDPVVSVKVSRETTVRIYVRDSCGNQATTDQLLPKEMIGYIKELRERIECSWQEIYPVFFGYNAPKVCLYKYPQRELVECKQAPAGDYSGGAETNFFRLPFGQDYYVIVEDGCYRDSAFFKDKTSAGGTEMNPFAWRCTTFDMHVDGNNSPEDTVCLWDGATNMRVSCIKANDTSINPNTGKPWPYGGAEWYDLPYGHYFAYIFDPCANELIRIDTIVGPRSNMEAVLRKHCSIGQSGIGSSFGPESPKPHKTTVLYPDGTVAGVYDYTGYLLYPTWPEPGTITVIQEDGCGAKDTSYFEQPMFLPVRSLRVKGGCPGINGESGGGDIILSGNSWAYGGPGSATDIPQIRIISKDGVPMDIPFTHTAWNSATNQQDFFFTNRTTGVYILESVLGCYGMKVYDTIEVKPYVYPTQGSSNIIQCGLNPYSFRNQTVGGLPPFTHEIVATNPMDRSFLRGPQQSDIFSIPANTNLESITIQILDACGNSNTAVHLVQKPNTCNPLLVDSLINRPDGQIRPTRVYPNPSGKQFNIAFSQKLRSDYQISIYNSTGVAVFSQQYVGVDTRVVPVAGNFKPGAYIIVITNLKNNRQEFFKHLVQ